MFIVLTNNNFVKGEGMKDVKDYCDNAHKRLVALKAGLYDVIVEAEKTSASTHADQAKQLRSIVDSVEKGLEELQNQCPSDWSPNKKRMDESMERLSKTLHEMASHLEISLPDSTAWV